MDQDGVKRLVKLAQSDNEFALKLLTEYAYGKPTQPLSGDSDPDAAPFRVSVTFDHASQDAD